MFGPGSIVERWPVYINDSGRVTCNAVECTDDDYDFSGIGRRTTFGAMEIELLRHILTAHEGVLK